MSSPIPMHMTSTGEFLIKSSVPGKGETFYRVRTTSDVEHELDEAELATLTGHIAVWKARPLLPDRPGRIITLEAIIEQMGRQGHAPARDIVRWDRILGGLTLSSASEALVRLQEYERQQVFLATPYADRPPVPTPTLTQIDLSRSGRTNIPGIKPKAWYLAKIDGDYYVDTFLLIGDQLLFGELEYKAPGYDESGWEALWLLEDPSATPKATPEGR